MSSSNGALTSTRPRGGIFSSPFRGSSPATFSIVKLLAASILHPTLSYAAPLVLRAVAEDDGDTADGPDLWVYLGTAIALVLLGGAFAGLTIALMGQDEIYLQVIATSGEGSEKRDATKVLNLLKRGKHWVLVTLLLSNVITNETLPIVLDRSLGGGWPAVVSSTVLIVIFGEIAPQSVCVRYGLTIGAWMAPFVLVLMWIMAPIAWPTAKLLDWLLGEDHGTTYKKAGLKTLVTLHKSLGQSPTERLNQDEVTIISAVLDLKEKPIGDIMTPMDDVFTMSVDTVLDEAMMDTILSQGYSRIPIYAPENPQNFIGMLLVKILITYDPEDALRVRDFALATLPETAPETSCLDIVNFFQEGKSHMVLVSESPGHNYGAIGVVTLEDVIEELIGEEIIDESDVFIDVHRAIRRIAPAPRMKFTRSSTTKDLKAHHITDSGADTPDGERPNGNQPGSRKSSFHENQRETTFQLRRRSSAAEGSPHGQHMTLRGTQSDMKEHLRHLGPSNAASRPKATKYTSVKIKPGVGTIPEVDAVRSELASPTRSARRMASFNGTTSGGRGAGLLDSAGSDAKDGAMTVAQGYGTIGFAPPVHVQSESDFHSEGGAGYHQTAAEASEQARQKASSPPVQRGGDDANFDSVGLSAPKLQRPGNEGRTLSKSRRTARSGSITESLVNIGGMKKVVLETQSSSDNENGNSSNSPRIDEGASENEQQNGAPQKAKKPRKRRGKKKSKSGNKSGETTPLLGKD
ncbi:hypothetical protein ANO11243_023410 [Dothideomycetidae sp. 11243]|nr:hypothetical protein ANO11243_023410 [fungal sp. No.11243]